MHSGEIKEQIMPAERKLSIIMAEWNYVQSTIKDEIDRKFKVRTWAITAFSTLLALSIHQDNALFVLFSVPAVLLFWHVDTVRQGTMEVLFKRGYEIEQTLQNASDKKLLQFNAPKFGSAMGNTEERRSFERKARFGRVRVLFFGSMILASFIIFLFLQYHLLRVAP